MSEEKLTQEQQDEHIKKSILAALENVIDPELGVDIINLGLVYRIDLDDNGTCKILMTLTTIGCPLTIELQDMIKTELMEIPEVKDVSIELTFDPPWSMERLSRYAKIALGLA
ncbi:metal-sulfur cluster assembly factor [Xylocopilactobacillus apicola]|uniref:DNA methyltransferase n=1 Tax=Xylocopilactobacillus apicola TaxID=2932184 RepID=A0AAU9DNG1_9LACO|nr:metal-sulfur cluster assembly factor [Xylocopilactobacillus apicola]BDR58617.1 DNA methyltransferase [Xylocopilactobacillus apicola]